MLQSGARPMFRPVPRGNVFVLRPELHSLTGGRSKGGGGRPKTTATPASHSLDSQSEKGLLMTVTTTERPIEGQSRAKRLKAFTSNVHEGVDRSIMSAASFASIDRYKHFLAIQYLFHRDVAVLYAEPHLQAAFPDLAARCRLPLVVADMEDLAIVVPETGPPAFIAGTPLDLGTALGWLYVAEGSNMGAALLRKEAAKLGLSDDFGARHLAPAPEGPAPHWRAFTASLDAVALTDEEEERADKGALEAFARVQAHVDARLG